MKRLAIQEGIVLGLVLGLTLALLWLLNGGSAAVLAQGPGPEIAVSPVFFDETLAWQEERTRTLTVANEGTGDLSFAVDVFQIVPSLLLHLDEPDGATTFYDASGGNNHGSCTGESCPTAGVGGQYGTAVSFDGIDDHVAVLHSASFAAIEDQDRVTVAAWFKITDWYSGFFSLVDKYKPSWDFGWTVQIDSTNGLQFVARPGQAGGDIWCNFVPNLGEWYHLAISYDRSEGQIRFFVNGDLQCESDFFAEIIDTEDGPLYIGYNPSGGDEYSNGMVDELVLYDRALSADEIQALIAWNWAGGDPPRWLSVLPAGGTVSAGSEMPIDVIFEASQVALPGTYWASLSVFGNAPFTPTVIVPVAMTVGPGSDMGQLQGTVMSDWPGGPIEGARVEVLSGTESLILGVTDASGLYGPWWLPSGAYTVRVSADLHLDDVQSVDVSAGVTTTHDVVLTRSTQRISTRVSASSDDAEEFPGGYVHLTSTHLDLIYDDKDQTVGLRFAGVDVPQGARIVDAYVQFQVDKTSSEITSLLIRGEAADDAAPIVNTNQNITLRTRTEEFAIWSPAPWTTVGEAGPDQRTPTLAPVIQEIVNRSGWSSGNALALIISGWQTQKRVAEPYDGLPSAAPLLFVEYEAGPPENQAPSVDAGPDQTVIVTDDAALDGAVSDDGLPDPPGTVTVAWSKMSGPGTVTFADAGAQDTTASFSETGEYVLRLTADDGELAAQDEVTVTVEPEPVNQPPTVDAGEEQTVVLPNEAVLDGTVTDDGLPDPPGAVTVAWSKVSGPGTVTFADPNVEDTTAGFSEAGEYVLSLAADDGELTAGDEVTITAGYYTCRARINDDPTDYTTVQAAVDAASEGDVVKVAGYCPGVSARAGTTQTVYLDKSITVRGGYTISNWTTPDPEAHPTTLDAQGQGPVLAIVGSIRPTVEGFRITGGVAADPGDGCGGGVKISDATATLRNNQVFSNSATYSGGGLCLWDSDAVLSGNTIYSNTAVWGGGLAVGGGAPTLDGNGIFSNTASSGGGGLAMDISHATLNQNTIAANSSHGLYAQGGNVVLTSNVVSANADRGIELVDGGDVTLNGNTISSNRGGGMRLVGRYATLNGNAIVSNTAAGGGALWIGGYSYVTSVNDVIADNQAGDAGSGIYVRGFSQLRLLHATLARNAGSAGLYIDSSVEMTDTILVGHEAGVYVASGATAQLEATLWGSGAWANGIDWIGQGTILTGTVNLWGAPAFVDPDAGDYHIGAGSAAIDAGVDAGVAVDMDGEPRPLGVGYDIGADEFPVESGATVEVRVAASSDDAEEFPKGYVHRTSPDLELIWDGRLQTVGLRFVGVEIPQGATIVEAYVQFQADETDTDAASLLIEGEATDDALTFTSVSKNITSRTRTGASVTWDPAPWTTVGEAGPDQRMTDLAPVIQEIVSRPGWASGNALALIISGRDTRKRVAESYEGSQAGAPLLHVEYVVGPPVNQAPTVDAGPNQAVVVTDEAVLDGTVTDDGLPDPPGAVTVEWSKVSGPGTATFADPNAEETTVSFSETGEYVLRLTADDGELTAQDEVTITVQAEPVNQAPSVDAGGDQTVVLPDQATLDGTVSDDGLPDPPGAVTVEWSRVSGPGTVTFADAGAEDTTATFSEAGEYVLSLTADDGELSANDEVTITVQEAGQVVTAEVRVSASSDDAEEFPAGYVHRTSTHLDLVYDDRLQTVGLRFVGVEIPQGATIVDAYVQFQVDKTSSEATSLLIEGQAADDALTFVNSSGDITSRLRTGANVAWAPVPWTTIGEAGPDQRTSDLAPVIQEIVNRAGWMSGNALALIISGSGRRVAEPYDGLPAAAPLLHVEYSVN